MSKRNWRRVQPSSLRQAMELCLEYARERNNLSVDRVADRMGLSSKWTLYKWLESGRMPTILIRPFELACGIDFVTRYLALSNHQLLIDIPQGRQATQAEINQLQLAFADAMGRLMRYYEGEGDPEKVVSELTGLLGGVAWHRENVQKMSQPELALFDEESAP